MRTGSVSGGKFPPARAPLRSGMPKSVKRLDPSAKWINVKFGRDNIQKKVSSQLTTARARYRGRRNSAPAENESTEETETSRPADTAKLIGCIKKLMNLCAVCLREWAPDIQQSDHLGGSSPASSNSRRTAQFIMVAILMVSTSHALLGA